METNERYSFNSNDLLYKIYTYRKPLLIITSLGFIISLIVSLFITPLYKSNVIVFPAPSTSISQSLITTINSYKKESVFGEVEEVEQILQVLNSDELRSKIIKKYDLWKHYKIDSAKVKYPLDKMLKKFQDRINFKRTEFMAVEIEVYDPNPDTAAMIANDICMLIDTVMNRMEKERAIEAFQIVKYEYDSKVAQLNKLEDSLQFIMQKGVFDFESQSEVLNKAYADAILANNTRGAQELKKQLDTLAKYGSAYISLRDFLYYEKEQLSLLNGRYKEAKVDAEQILTHFYVVNKAFKSDKKAKPKRIIIVTVSTLSTFALAFVLLIFVELLQDLRKKNSVQAIQ
ncbi:MAG TPA: Wzz/FepE/Etk N-terminal domain-containing protein [Bacteroidales bacterium]|jgi:capsular polysaccharide biosynthesis protein|nr:Wzz/FepE/Etk N-terminal domain-containing protein [Bacteroidales bacterium]HRS18084.1 Wzz/FepE/Etk N-terminal domain-containing protein [Bacteroidales bacterium]